MNSNVIIAVVAAVVLGSVVYNWRIADQKKPAVTLRVVNVLDKNYFDDAHIKGSATVESIGVPFAQLEATAKNWDKTVPVVTYCANYQCTASGAAAKKLKELGFTDVWAYEGGTAEWYQLGQTDANYVTEGPAREGYLKGTSKKPSTREEGVQEITALELQKKIKDATM